MGIGNIDYIHSIKRLELLAFLLTSYKIFKTCFQIKDLLSSETSCLCPYKESEIPENDTSHFRVPYNLYSGNETIPINEIEGESQIPKKLGV